MQRSSHTAALPKLSCHWRVSLHRWRFSSVQQGARMNEYKSMFSHLAGMFRFRGNSKLEVSNPRQVYCVICKKAFLCSGSITIVNYCMQVKHLGLPKYQKSHEKKQAAIDTYSGRSQSVQKEESLAQALTWWIISVSQPLTIVEDAILVKVLQSALDSPYQPPSGHVMSANVDTLFNAKEWRLQQKFSTASSTSSTADLWTSITNYAYLGIFAHWTNDGLGASLGSAAGWTRKLMTHS